MKKLGYHAASCQGNWPCQVTEEMHTGTRKLHARGVKVLPMRRRKDIVKTDPGFLKAWNTGYRGNPQGRAVVPPLRKTVRWTMSSPVVLDEADEMLNWVSWRRMWRTILSQLPEAARP